MLRPSGLSGGQTKEESSADDHEEAQDLESGDRFAEGENSHHGDQGGAHSGPDGIDDPHLQCFQGKRHQGETAQIKANHPDGGQETAKAVRKLQAKGA